MKKSFFGSATVRAALFALCIAGLFSGCAPRQKATGKADVEPKEDWHLGVALWTFHTFNIVQASAKVDSSGLKYIEPNTFQKVGGEFGDTALGKLSLANTSKLAGFFRQKGFTVRSVYVTGGKEATEWISDFEHAKALGAKFVTAEPPEDQWDLVDSLAGVYSMQVAIHDHWKGVSHYWHPDSVLAAVKDHPHFGACADLGHWPKSGIDPVNAIKTLKGHIISLHLKDIAAFNDPKLVDVPVGTGVIDFPAVFAELKRQEFKGCIYIERDAEEQPSNLPSVIETVKYYNDQLSKLN